MPVTLSSDVPYAVSDISFVDQDNGYLFGPSLFQTHDSGLTWHPASLPVTTVKSVVATGGYAYAMAYSGADIGVWSLWQNRVGTDTWLPVPLPALQGGSFNLYAEEGTLLLLGVGDDDDAGQLWSSVDNGLSWTAHAVPCSETDGGVSVGSIALGHPGAWLVDCFNGEQSQQEQHTQHHLYGTANGGNSWVRLGDPSDTGSPVSLADNGSGRAVLTVEGAASILSSSSDYGLRWTLGLSDDGGYGWAGLQFVSASTGFVVGPTYNAPEHLYRTDNGGVTWQTLSIADAPAPSNSACTSAQLTLSAGPKLAAAGHVGLTVRFHNDGSTDCMLSGYPGVAGLNAFGEQRIQARRTPWGYIGGLHQPKNEPLPVIDVPPGGTASALVEGTDSAPGCQSYQSLIVTIPHTYQQVPIAVAMPGCTGLQIHPVVPGTQGRLAR
jgi:hypothetical protein